VHDLWPLTPIELGGMSPRHPFILLLQRAENYAYRNAHRVASMLPKADSYMREHGMDAHKFSHIPNGIDVAEWQRSTAPIPQEHCGALARLQREGRFLVGYAGSHGLANALSTLVDAAQLLQSQPVAFVLVGQGPEKDSLKKRAEQLGLTNMLFLPPVARETLPQLLAPMNALFIGWGRKPIYRFGISPNKLMDYMMAARPVIHATEAGNDPVLDCGCGISVAPEDPPAVARAVLRLMCLAPADRQAMGLRGKEYALTHHDYRVLGRQFLEIMH
jgi:glycosyltransferase involved in cell wall biosynthesis